MSKSFPGNSMDTAFRIRSSASYAQYPHSSSFSLVFVLSQQLLLCLHIPLPSSYALHPRSSIMKVRPLEPITVQ